MKAVQLNNTNGQPMDIWVCSKCNYLYHEKMLPVDRNIPGKHIGTVREMADDCCTPKNCEGCGEIVPVVEHKTYTERPGWCKKCLDGKNVERDMKRIEAAEKLEEWDGWVFWNDEFYQSVEDCNEALEDELGHHLIEYIFTCKPIHPVALDMTNYFERVDDNAGVDDGDCLEKLEGVEEIEVAVEIFNQKNITTILGWEPDYKRAVRLKKK